MKQRPRYAENRIAQELSDVFVPLGYEYFVRIPANGRTGPDITVNNTKLVVDAKSRVSNPKLYFEGNAPPSR